MPVMAIYRSDTISPGEYARFRRKFPLVSAPRGALTHAHGKTETGFVTVEIWEDRESLKAFVYGVLAPLAEELHLPLVEPEVIEVEDLVHTPGCAGVRKIPFGELAIA